MILSRNNFDQLSDSTEIYVAKLAYIGATIATIGGGLQVIAAEEADWLFNKRIKYS